MSKLNGKNVYVLQANMVRIHVLRKQDILSLQCNNQVIEESATDIVFVSRETLNEINKRIELGWTLQHVPRPHEKKARRAREIQGTVMMRNAHLNPMDPTDQIFMDSSFHDSQWWNGRPL